MRLQAGHFYGYEQWECGQVRGLNLTTGCARSFSEKGWLQKDRRVRYLVWEKGYAFKVCDGSIACLDIYLGKLWCSISKSAASEKTPPPSLQFQ